MLVKIKYLIYKMQPIANNITTSSKLDPFLTSDHQLLIYNENQIIQHNINFSNECIVEPAKNYNSIAVYDNNEFIIIDGNENTYGSLKIKNLPVNDSDIVLIGETIKLCRSLTINNSSIYIREFRYDAFKVFVNGQNIVMGFLLILDIKGKLFVAVFDSITMESELEEINTESYCNKIVSIIHKKNAEEIKCLVETDTSYFCYNVCFCKHTRKLGKIHSQNKDYMMYGYRKTQGHRIENWIRPTHIFYFNDKFTLFETNNIIYCGVSGSIKSNECFQICQCKNNYQIIIISDISFLSEFKFCLVNQDGSFCVYNVKIYKIFKRNGVFSSFNITTRVQNNFDNIKIKNMKISNNTINIISKDNKLTIITDIEYFWKIEQYCSTLKNYEWICDNLEMIIYPIRQKNNPLLKELEEVTNNRAVRKAINNNAGRNFIFDCLMKNIGHHFS